MGQQRITLDHIIAAADCNDGATKMTTLNLKTLAAGLDSETFEWWGNQDSITVCRLYGQRLIRNATYEEPAHYRSRRGLRRHHLRRGRPRTGASGLHRLL